jgi:hypothetical protein
VGSLGLLSVTSPERLSTLYGQLYTTSSNFYSPERRTLCLQRLAISRLYVPAIRCIAYLLIHILASSRFVLTWVDFGHVSKCFSGINPCKRPTDVPHIHHLLPWPSCYTTVICLVIGIALLTRCKQDNYGRVHNKIMCMLYLAFDMSTVVSGIILKLS